VTSTRCGCSRNLLSMVIGRDFLWRGCQNFRASTGRDRSMHLPEIWNDRTSAKLDHPSAKRRLDRRKADASVRIKKPLRRFVEADDPCVGDASPRLYRRSRLASSPRSTVREPAERTGDLHPTDYSRRQSKRNEQRNRLT